MRYFVIPETFFKSIAEKKDKLYSRLWFYWLSEFVDEIFEPEFIEKQVKAFPKVGEIKEIYAFGVQLLQQDEFKILEKKGKRQKERKPIGAEIRNAAIEVIHYLNSKAGTTFSVETGNNIYLIAARMKEGYSVAEFKVVIDKKIYDWNGTEYTKYLTPMTLFNKTKFENYLNSNSGGKNKERSNFQKFTDSIDGAELLIGVRSDKGRD